MGQLVPSLLPAERPCDDIINLCFRLNDAVVKLRLSIRVDKRVGIRPRSCLQVLARLFDDGRFVFPLELVIFLLQLELVLCCHHEFGIPVTHLSFHLLKVLPDQGEVI